MSRPYCLVAAAAVALVVAAGPAGAADIRWSNKPVEYSAVEPKDLRAFLREFAAQQGMAVSIDPEVKGELTGRYNLTPRSMMELLARTYGLIYYYDGKVLHIAPSTAVENDVLRLTNSTPVQFQRSLERMGITDSRYPLAADPEQGTVMVSGPKRMVELVRQAAAATERRSVRGNETPETATRVYPLRYAIAEDYTVRAGGKDYRVLGVASILRQTFGPGGWRAAPATPGRVQVVQEAPPAGNQPVLPVLQGSRRAGTPGGTAATTATPSAEDSAVLAGAPAANPAPAALPSISADPRTNAIIVRDLPGRLSSYDELIARLDERPKLVELEVNIIEINTDDFAALGIDWKALGGDVSFETGSGRTLDAVNNPRGFTPDPLNPLNPARVVGSVQGGVFALLTGGRSGLVARISALEQNGRANVRAQPRLLTLNNIEAVLESINTFYVKVEGFQDAQLFDVNVGTAIRLTPSVIEPTPAPPSADPNAAPQPAAPPLVRMLVRIEDGAITEQSVQALPVIQRSNIGTQALMTDQATLLIAGYSQDRQRDTLNAVPGLSSIPILGNLFKSKSTNRQRVERLFMITPRVVDIATAGVARPPALGSGPQWVH